MKQKARAEYKEWWEEAAMKAYQEYLEMTHSDTKWRTKRYYDIYGRYK